MFRTILDQVLNGGLEYSQMTETTTERKGLMTSKPRGLSGLNKDGVPEIHSTRGRTLR